MKPVSTRRHRRLRRYLRRLLEACNKAGRPYINRRMDRETIYERRAVISQAMVKESERYAHLTK